MFKLIWSTIGDVTQSGFSFPTYVEICAWSRMHARFWTFSKGQILTSNQAVFIRSGLFWLVVLLTCVSVLQFLNTERSFCAECLYVAVAVDDVLGNRRESEADLISCMDHKRWKLTRRTQDRALLLCSSTLSCGVMPFWSMGKQEFFLLQKGKIAWHVKCTLPILLSSLSPTLSIPTFSSIPIK